MPERKKIIVRRNKDNKKPKYSKDGYLILSNGAELLAYSGEYVLARWPKTGFPDGYEYITWHLSDDWHCYHGYYFTDLNMARANWLARSAIQ